MATCVCVRLHTLFFFFFFCDVIRSMHSLLVVDLLNGCTAPHCVPGSNAFCTTHYAPSTLILPTLRTFYTYYLPLHIPYPITPLGWLIGNFWEVREGQTQSATLHCTLTTRTTHLPLFSSRSPYAIPLHATFTRAHHSTSGAGHPFIH